MDLHAWISVATLLTAMTLFVSRWIPLEATALGIPVVLAFTGVLNPEQCLSGFSNQAVVALGAIFILGAGLKESGVATLIARGLQRVGGGSTTRTIVILMIAAAVMSAFMSNTATVAVLLPAVALLGRQSNMNPAKLMMPLSFAAILGGTLTLIGTSPNLILGNDLQLRTGSGLGMFEFVTVGGPVTAVGVAFMALIGWRMLPERGSGERRPRAEEVLASAYGLTNKLVVMRVNPDTPIVGRTIAEVGFGVRYGLDIVLLMRGRRSIHPRPDLVLALGDELYVEGEPADVVRVVEEKGLTAGPTDAAELERILTHGLTLAEVSVAPRSAALGKTFRELAFRQRFGLNVISIWRGDKVFTAATGDTPLRLGDAFLVSGMPARVHALAHHPDYVVLGEGEVSSEDVRRAPLAVFLLVLTLLPPLLGWMPLAISAIAGALAMVFTSCLSIASARKSVDFTILFLVIGTIPLGIALEQSQVAAKMATAVLLLEPSVGVPGLIGALFVLAAVLSTTSNNSAAAIILAPVAAEVAAASPLDVSRAFLAVAFGASCTFVLPFAHQCNLLVMGPAGYSTRDFVRVGVPMSILMAVTTVTLLSLGW